MPLDICMMYGDNYNICEIHDTEMELWYKGAKLRYKGMRVGMKKLKKYGYLVSLLIFFLVLGFISRMIFFRGNSFTAKTPFIVDEAFIVYELPFDTDYTAIYYFDGEYVYVWEEHKYFADETYKVAVFDIKGRQITPWENNRIERMGNLFVSFRGSHPEKADARYYDMEGNHLEGLDGLNITQFINGYAAMQNPGEGIYLIDREGNIIRALVDRGHSPSYSLLTTWGLFYFMNDEYLFVVEPFDLLRGRAISKININTGEITPTPFRYRMHGVGDRFIVNKQVDEPHRNGFRVILDLELNEIFSFEGRDFTFHYAAQHPSYIAISMVDDRNNVGLYNIKEDKLVLEMKYRTIQINTHEIIIVHEVDFNPNIERFKILNIYGDTLYEFPETTFDRWPENAGRYFMHGNFVLDEYSSHLYYFHNNELKFISHYDEILHPFRDENFPGRFDTIIYLLDGKYYLVKGDLDTDPA